jgi:hypothetical protein
MNWRKTIPMLMAGVLATSSFAKPPKPAESPKVQVGELEYQIVALKLLRQLNPTGDQVQAMLAVSAASGGKPAVIPVAPAEFKTALSEYADALAEGDDDKIGTTEDRVDDLRDELKIDAPPDPLPTEGARAAADKIVAKLSPAQLAGYLAEHADEVPDPVGTLIDAADQSRAATADEFAAVKSEAAEQFGMLVGGVDPAASAPLATAAADWLEKVKRVPDKDYEAGRDQRVRDVRAMTHDVDSFVVLRHWMDREMVDLLSNPQLAVSLKRLKL